MAHRPQHVGDREQLADMAERLLAGVATVRLSAGQLAAVRWQLCRQLLSHLGPEDRALYPRTGLDRRVAGESSAFDEAAANGPFQHFLEHWTNERIADDSAGFCADIIRLMSDVLGQIAEQRRHFPPSAVTQGRRAG